MKTKNNQKIKVDKNVKPSHFETRQEPKLIVGNNYYVSFGMNEALPCILLKIIDNKKGLLKQIQIGIKNNSERGYGDIAILYSDEIGTTPEEAVLNEKTS